MERSWSRWRNAAAALALALAAGCAEEATENPLTSRPVGAGDAARDRGVAPADDIRDLVDDAIHEVEAYWEDTYPAVYGGQFEPLAGGYHPYGPDTDLPPCGPVSLTYEEIAGNAFYCPIDDLIAWDEATLIPDLNETFGALTVGIVFAHEFAHVIQERADVSGRTIDLELQADCYAGAWTAHVADGRDDAFDVTDRELDSSVAGMVAIRDLPGTDENDPMAHGSAFDRIGSFQEGYEDGPEHCASYEDAPRQTVEIPFNPDELTQADPGNFPLEDQGPTCPDDLDDRVLSGQYDPASDEAQDCGLASLLEADLNVYYAGLFAELGQSWQPVDDLVFVDPRGEPVRCGGETLSGDDLRLAALYCQDENVVILDGTELTTALYDIGDFAVGAEVARLWAVAAQARLGVAGDSIDESLQADCLTGMYARWSFPADRLEEGEPSSSLLTISAGDLDEGIMGFIAFGDSLASRTGTAFERTAALRTGAIDGREGCAQEYGPLA